MDIVVLDEQGRAVWGGQGAQVGVMIEGEGRIAVMPSCSYPEKNDKAGLLVMGQHAVDFRNTTDPADLT